MEEHKVEEKHNTCCSDKQGYCYCKAIMAILIIVLTWWAPTWANIGITILAAMIVFSAGSCCACGKNKK